MQAPSPSLSKLIAQQIQHIHLLQEKTNQLPKQKQSLFNEDFSENHVDVDTNVYFDKQLIHLVVAEEFDFQKISELLEEVFRGQKVDTSVRACRTRWAFLYANRDNMGILREKQKENKRLKSVAAFSNPYSLYNVDELIENLQKSESQPQPRPPIPTQPTPTGYNIFKDSFRKIQDMQAHSALEAKMKQALKEAQEHVYEDKPLFFTPQYQLLEQFKVKEEELTADKVKQLMAYQIQMEKVGREMEVKMEQQEEQRYEDIVKKRLDQEAKQKPIKYANSAQLEDNWDEYESD